MIKELQKTVALLEHDLEIKNKIIKNYEKQLRIYGTMDKYSDLLNYIREHSLKGIKND